jgi:hypothetical protein
MAARPPLADVFRMACALGRGSVIDAPKSVFGVLRELAGDTPADSPLTLKALMRRKDYRDLMTPKIAPGQPAFDFELPQHDVSDEAGSATEATVCLSDFRGVQPVALIFGSYT